MFKIAGVTVIIISSVSAAFIYSSGCRRRIAVNEGMLDLISYIRARILFFRDPLSLIFADYQNESLEKTGFLSEVPDAGFGAALSNSGILHLFDKNTSACLVDFSKKLGRTGVEEQINNCDMCISLLTDNLKAMKAELPDRARMYSSLCVIAGLGAVLLII